MIKSIRLANIKITEKIAHDVDGMPNNANKRISEKCQYVTDTRAKNKRTQLAHHVISRQNLSNNNRAINFQACAIRRKSNHTKFHHT